MSLVPDYGDSDGSNSDDNETKLPVNDEKNEDTSSTSDSELENDNKITEISSPIALPGEKLPVPGFLNKDNRNKKHSPLSTSTPSTTSVFTNPFVEAENAKQFALEKHVKMIDGGAAMTINGKKVCWNYRKGRCRFGHNCKYAHDSDLQKTKAQLAHEKNAMCQSGGEPDAMPPLQLHKQWKQSTHDSDLSGAGDDLATNAKRKRPGLSQGLQPGKKVLKQYHKLKSSHHN